MKIYQLKIKNFRGVKEATFKFSSPLVCLIGLGDSTKTTILDAIEYVLCPNWFIPIDDSDFTDCDISENIEITATVGPVTEDFKSVYVKYGSDLRGWDKGKNELHDEPAEGDIHVLSIRLTIDNTLAPEWSVVSNRFQDEHHISYRDRQTLGVSKIRDNIDAELAWTRGSSLLRMSKDRKEAEKVLLEANRTLREIGLTDASFNSLNESIKSAKKRGKKYGINTKNLKANIDPKNLRGNTSTISLHDGDVPFRRMGLGTRRLMSIGLQLSDTEEGAILLIDEIEQALEPHRLKHLLRTLKKSMEKPGCGQIFMTTHSPATLEELGAEGVYCVHYDSDNKKTNVDLIKPETQGTIRRIPKAFLSPKIIVCEGQTEIGLLRAFEKQQIARNGYEYSFAYNKTTIVNGEGSSQAPERAYHLALNKYSACLLIDSDELASWKVNEADLIKAGVKIARWDENYKTEMQICMNIPLDSVLHIIELAISLNSNLNEDKVLDSINSGLSCTVSTVAEIKNHIGEENNLRIAVAKSASNNDWFKNITYAEKLGDYLFDEIYDKIKDAEFYKRFLLMQNWARNEQ